MSSTVATQTDELRAKLEKLELALSAIVDAIVWIDAEGRVQWYNAPLLRLVDRQAADVQGARLVDVLPLEERGKVLRTDAHPVSVALNGQPNAAGSYEFRKGSQRIILEIFAARVQFSKHEISTVVAIRDVTTRKEAEKKQQGFAAAAAAAATAAKKRAAELDKAYKELKSTQGMLVQAEKMVAVGQLASGIAHEVKNPLQVIEQGISCLEDDLGDDHGQLSEILRMLREAIARANGIIRRTLDFSRPSQLTLELLAIRQVVDGALELTEKQLTVQDVDIRTVLDPGLPLVLLDENRMQQVFINLILNAFQAMPNGGRLSIRAYTKRLVEKGHSVGYRSADGFRPGETVLICEVADTGEGISKDDLDKVFDPFFSTKPPGQGTGLGLCIVRTIVEGHGGLIHVESQKGRGTTFRLMLPIDKGR